MTERKEWPEAGIDLLRRRVIYRIGEVFEMHRDDYTEARTAVNAMPRLDCGELSTKRCLFEDDGFCRNHLANLMQPTISEAELLRDIMENEVKALVEAGYNLSSIMELELAGDSIRDSEKTQVIDEFAAALSALKAKMEGVPEPNGECPACGADISAADIEKPCWDCGAEVNDVQSPPV